nr:hypothetical protein [Tanacetum cinerariifolium]
MCVKLRSSPEAKNTRSPKEKGKTISEKLHVVFRMLESIPEADIPLQKRARFTTPTSRYEIGESSVAAARQIRPTLTVAESHRADGKLIGRQRRERRYFRTVATHYVQEVAHSRDYCARIMDYCQSREVHTSTLVTQMEALRREKIAPKKARTTRANLDPTKTTTATEPMTQEAINNLIAQRVAEAIAEYETQRNSVVNGDTSNTTGTGARIVRPTRECTYKDYLNCGPLKFNGIEGVIGLTRWFERTESVFSIINCTSETQVKFASCTLIGSALTWWNSHMRAVGQEVAYAMPWKTLKQMMTAKYCPRSEVKKLEVDLWNLKVKGTDISSYTLRFQDLIGSALTWWNSHMRAVGQEVAYAIPWKTLKQMMTVKYCPRSEVKKLEVDLWNLKVKGTDISSYTLRFQELSLLCGRMFPEESDEIERYPEIVETKLLTLTTTTTGEPQWHIREYLLALSVELRVITREIAR